MPTMQYSGSIQGPPIQLGPQVDRIDYYQQSPDGRYTQIPGPQVINTYNGPEVNLMGNPNIPAGVTSVPAPQNMRYASGYVPTGESNPRSESAVDVRNAPETGEFVRAVIAERKAQAAV